MDEPSKIELVREPDDADTRSAQAHPRRLNHWLGLLIERGGSDLLLVSGSPACIRLKGEVLNVDMRPLGNAEIEAAVLPALSL